MSTAPNAGDDRHDFESVVRRLEERLRTLRSSASDNRDVDEWLRALHQSYTSRFLSDNNRIWTTGAIMIPLSLAPLAGMATLDSPEFAQRLVLGVASMITISAWVLVAENHHAFQRKSMAWMEAIERAMGSYVDTPSKLPVDFINRLISVKSAVRWVRRGLWIMMLIAWVIVVCFWPHKEPSDDGKRLGASGSVAASISTQPTALERANN